MSAIKIFMRRLGRGNSDENGDQILLKEQIPTSSDMVKEPLPSSPESEPLTAKELDSSPSLPQNSNKWRDRATMVLVLLTSLMICTAYGFLGTLLPNEVIAVHVYIHGYNNTLFIAG